ncbi:OsmC family protein [Limosilactobacillus difficilis]|uniref:OsmC family protein n=1 Tax=Limosilactobacillus difficilis TaxID=2991838 RepID=UPI0024BAF922|nr:OsmC family protein [Limosilactobacillus difficilis]
MSEYRVTSNLRPAGYQVMIKAGQHQYLADEPTPAGTDAGPNPVQYLIGALNGCLTISAKALAKKHGINLRDVRITSHGTVDKLGGGRTAVTAIDTTVDFDCDLNDQEKQDLLDNTLRVCTVHESLSGSIKMNIHLA